VAPPSSASPIAQAILKLMPEFSASKIRRVTDKMATEST